MPGRDHRPAKAVGSKTTHPRAGALISFSDAYQQEIHSQGIASDGNGAVFTSLYFFYLSATLLFDLSTEEFGLSLHSCFIKWYLQYGIELWKWYSCTIVCLRVWLIVIWIYNGRDNRLFCRDSMMIFSYIRFVRYLKIMILLGHFTFGLIVQEF